MSLKSFITSGVKDVLEGQVNKLLNKNGGQNNSADNQSTHSSVPPMQPHGSYNQNSYNQPGQPGGYGSGYPSYPPQNSQSSYPGNEMPGGGAPYPRFDQGSGYPGSGAPYPGSAGGVAPPIGFIDGASSYPQQVPSSQTGGFPSQNYNTGYNPYGGNPSVQPQYYPQQPGQQYSPQSNMIGNPSVRPTNPFNANQDAEVLRKAMKGLGCNNSKVISILCTRTNMQRQEISRAFKVMYGKDLIKDLRSELSGDFEDLILALMEPPAIYDAKQLRKAMEGLGTKESVLIEIMTSRTNQQIHEVRAAYKQLYGKELENELIGETSGCFKRLLISLCAGGRDEGNHVDPLRANQDARKLYQAGERRLGTDESAFNAILASQNYHQLRLVFDEYQKVSNHSIEKAVESEFSGDIRDGLLAVCNVVRSRPAYFAKLLNDSMKGFGTRDGDLIRLVVTRCEYDMADIRDAFQAMYKTSLENMIKGDCSGSYKDGLITLVRGN